MAEKGIATRAVHGRRRRVTGPLTTPIVASATFTFASSAEMQRYLDGDEDLYLYTRYANPTLRDLEESVAALEGGESALVLASGMAAMTTVILSMVKSGDEVLASAALYGGTSRLLGEVLPALGVHTRLVAVEDLPRVGALAGPTTRAVVLESPTNPILSIVDIRATAASAHERGVAVVVDNTFATPVLQQPLALGADVVMHSLTKALAGHGDVIGGVLVGSRERIEKARSMMKVLGGCLDPHAASLALRGLKTLELRVRRQCENALRLARHLEAHPKVPQVRYPGLASHPGHEIAARQMADFGGIVTFVLGGGLAAAKRFYDRLNLVSRAASLGSVETLVSLPLQTSHFGYTAEQLREAGIDPGMVRVSVGVEDVADIIEDVDQALAGV
jgi:cystathionine beta-lyase/cystathionine gamma-synthase